MYIYIYIYIYTYIYIYIYATVYESIYNRGAPLVCKHTTIVYCMLCRQYNLSTNTHTHRKHNTLHSIP